MTVYPLLLAIGSSIDNFVVGFALSLSGKGKRRMHVKPTFNLFISTVNAFGACLSVLGGSIVFNGINTDAGKEMASLLAGIAFAYLAYDELKSTRTAQDGSSVIAEDSRDTSWKNAIRVSIPMTLNNVAGGVAGGAAGISASSSFGMAFIASFSMMDFGHILGYYCQERLLKKQTAGISSGKIDSQTESFVTQKCHLLAGMIFALLACSQLGNYFTA
jgi:putative Mn2+ efflux pump MntP